MQTRTAAIAAALHGLTGVDGLRPLLRLLGFGEQWLEIQTQHWPRSLVELGVKRLVSAGDRAGLAALVVELATVSADDLARLGRRLREQNPAQLRLLVCADAHGRQLAIASLGIQPDLLALIVEASAICPSDLEAIHELCGEAGEGGLQLSLRHARALDRTRVTRRFFIDFKAQRNAIARRWTHMRADAEERNRLALLFLCRMLFLYFLQKRGHLGAPDYLYDLWRAWCRRRHNQSFFAARLKPLFFGVLNTRPEHRSGGARRFGDLPYLNGGLFELHTLERRHGKIDLPDPVLRSVFDDLLQRYRFTTVDAAQAPLDRMVDTGIDPEMLGRVFEELMAEQQRGETGTYFTPPVVVDRMVGDALATWRDVHGAVPTAVTVLDPACGSGAFLLGTLARLSGHRDKREIVEHALHGVDLQGDAALLCALRLWLCLLPGPGEKVRPLPNLDRRIRQGDALLDPLDLAYASVDQRDRGRIAATDPLVRSALKRLRPLGARYVRVGPDQRQHVRNLVQQEEVRLAGAWLAAHRRSLEHECRELTTRGLDVDLFGEPTREAVAAGARLADVKNRLARIARLESELHERSALPFFSFPVHFGDTAPAGFDLVVSNPPWIRAHNWPESLGKAVRQRFEVCQGSESWSSAQVDLSLLFLERSLYLLKPAGVLALLLPAKTFRSLYAGRARALLLRETQLSCIEDHSLDQHSIFSADAFAGAIVAARAREHSLQLRVRCYRRAGAPLEFAADQRQLPLRPGDPASPWLLVPPDVHAVLRKMQLRGKRIADDAMLPIHRGAFTGANDVLLIERFEPKLGDHAVIHAEGHRKPHGTARRASYRALVEESCVRPALRGSNLRAWYYEADGYLLWSHAADGQPIELPFRAKRYVQRHRPRLQARNGWKAGLPLGSVFRVAPHTLGCKVAWRDLATDLQASALPARVRSNGRLRELIPLNTVYYIAVASEQRAQLLAAFLNALPLRVFARAIAERAKDAHFRFFAWVIAELPLPNGWEREKRVAAIAQRAHEQRSLEAGGQDELDHLVAHRFGLDEGELATLREYADWLEGK